MPVTAIVVSYNEERRLEACLKSLKFCSQLIVVDIGSTDHSMEIARTCGAQLIIHPWVPIGELVLPDTIGLSISDWILHLDPDTIVPNGLSQSILDRLRNIDKNVGRISLPEQFYFREKPLATSVWGGIVYNPRLFHRDRVIYSKKVHRGQDCIEGFVTQKIDYNGKNALEHYWIDTYFQLWDKHWRYIKLEGKSRYEDGKRFSVFYLFMEIAKASYIGLIQKKGWRGGLIGIFLSLFYTWYSFMSVMSLAIYQLKKNTNKRTHLD